MYARCRKQCIEVWSADQSAQSAEKNFTLTLCLRLSHNCDVRGRAHNAAVAYLRQDREAS